MSTMAVIDSPVLLYIISVTNPLQGVANAIVYFRPQYKTFRDRDHNELRLASAFRAVQLRVPKVLHADYQMALHPSNGDCTGSDAGNLEKGLSKSWRADYYGSALWQKGDIAACVLSVVTIISQPSEEVGEDNIEIVLTPNS